MLHLLARNPIKVVAKGVKQLKTNQTKRIQVKTKTNTYLGM